MPTASVLIGVSGQLPVHGEGSVRSVIIMSHIDTIYFSEIM